MLATSYRELCSLIGSTIKRPRQLNRVSEYATLLNQWRGHLPTFPRRLNGAQPIPARLGAISTEGQERGCLSRSMSNDESAWDDPNVSVRPKALRLGQPRSDSCV